MLAYQDDDTRQHARLTAMNVFYTVPGTGSRSLIRYTNEEEIWFERVYSIPNYGFEGYLVFLDEFDQKAHSEYKHQENAKKHSGTWFCIIFPV